MSEIVEKFLKNLTIKTLLVYAMKALAFFLLWTYIFSLINGNFRKINPFIVYCQAIFLFPNLTLSLIIFIITGNLELTHTKVWYIIEIVSLSPSYFCIENIEFNPIFGYRVKITPDINPINGLMELSWWLQKGMTIVCRSYVIDHKFINPTNECGVLYPPDIDPICG